MFNQTPECLTPPMKLKHWSLTALHKNPTQLAFDWNACSFGLDEKIKEFVKTGMSAGLSKGKNKTKYSSASLAVVTP